MNKYRFNKFYTTDLVLNVMATCARRVEKDIHDDEVADVMYDICCDLESFPEDEGFGSSDHYSYVNQARKHYGLTTHQEYSEAMATVARYLAETVGEKDIWNEEERAHKEIERLTKYFQKELNKEAA